MTSSQDVVEICQDAASLHCVAEQMTKITYIARTNWQTVRTDSMTLIEQISAQKALMESKGAIALRLEMGLDAMEALDAKVGRQIEGLSWKLQPGMEGFTILGTWPEPAS